MSSHLFSASDRVSPTTIATGHFFWPHMSAKSAVAACLGQFGKKDDSKEPGGSILLTGGKW